MTSKILAGFALLLLSFVASAAPDVDFKASRTSGAGPLAVLFDATNSYVGASPTAGTDCDNDGTYGEWRDDYAECLYRWDFDDPTSGTWAYTGKSKDVAYGHLAAHVFECNSGTTCAFDVSLTVTDPAGNSTTSTATTITVTDPDSQWSGTETTCVSNTASFTGCPSGAEQVTSSSASSGLGSRVDGSHRILFNKGDSFTCGYIDINHASPISIGAFGSGSRPTFTGCSSGAFEWGTSGEVSSRHVHDVRVVGISFDSGSNTNDNDGISGKPTKTGSHVLVMDTAVNDYKRLVHLNRFLLTASGSDMFDGVFFVDNEFDEPSDSGEGEYVVAVSCEDCAFMGNLIKHRADSAHDEPNTRIFWSQRLVMTNNKLDGQLPSKAVVKWMSCDAASGIHVCGTAAANGHEETEHVIFSDNWVVGGDGGAYITSWGPQTPSDPDNEQIRWFLIERNYITAGADVQSAIIFWGADSDIRHNIINMDGGAFQKSIRVEKRGGMPNDITGVRIIGNTCVLTDTVTEFKCATISGEGSADSVTANTLMWAPNASATTLVSGGAVSSGNLEASVCPFASCSSFSDSSDYQLDSDSQAVDAGSTTDFAALVDFRDYKVPDPTSGDYDVGAFEYNSEPADGGTPPVGPTAPSGLSATAVSSSQINLAWTDNSDETGFEIDLSTNGGSSFTLLTTTAANAESYNHTGRDSNTEYCYRVRAVNGSGNSSYTSTACDTTDDVAPTAPSGLTATAVSSSQINLGWTGNSDNETGFEIDLSTNAGVDFTLLTTTAANIETYEHGGRAAETQYCYRVRAVNAVGNSSYTPTTCDTTDPAPTVSYAPVYAP